jgi:predicted DNA-binding protein
MANKQRVTRTYRLPSALVERLEVVAAPDGRELSIIVQHALESYLDGLEKTRRTGTQ